MIYLTQKILHSLCDQALRNEAQALWQERGEEGDCDEITQNFSVDCTLQGIAKTFLPGHFSFYVCVCCNSDLNCELLSLS